MPTYSHVCLHFLLGSTEVWQSYREALLLVERVQDEGTVNPLLLWLLLSPGKTGWYKDCGSGQSDQGMPSRDKKLKLDEVEQLVSVYRQICKIEPATC